MDKRLYRSRTDRMISGVCGGIAEYFAIDPTIVRLATVALLLVTSGAVFLIYIVMAIVVPEMPAQGEPDSPRAMTTEEISAGAQGFARDIQTAAHKAVGGAAGAGGTASGAVPADAPVETPPVEGAEPPQPATPPADGAEQQSQAAPAASAASEHRSGGTGAMLIGVLLIAFGLLVFVQRTVGLDLLSMGWRLFVPGVIILLGVLILIRALRKG